MTIDHKLGWSTHIKELKKSFSDKLSLIKKSRFLPKQDLLNLYFKVIIPAVTYGISICGGTNRQDDLDLLERLHCRAARVIYNFAKDIQPAEVLTRAKWDSLRTFYKQSVLKVTYKMYHNDLPSCMTANIAKSQTSYNLRTVLNWKSHLLNRISKSIPYLIEVQFCGITCQSSAVKRIVSKVSPG